MNLSDPFGVEYTIRLFAAFFELSPIADLLSLNLAYHLEQSLLHPFLEIGLNMLISLSHFAEPFKFSVFELALDVPAVPTANSFNVLFISCAFDAVSVFKKIFALALNFPILPAALINIPTIESVLPKAMLLVEEKFSLV